MVSVLNPKVVNIFFILEDKRLYECGVHAYGRYPAVAGCAIGRPPCRAHFQVLLGEQEHHVDYRANFSVPNASSVALGDKKI